uniref:Reverse transcriptase domain-containing protein n=1 Tax=Stegastes partitus TaxID=144197 RepID=A0A3B5AYM1_9TELE
FRETNCPVLPTNILLHRLQYTIGLSDIVHNWFTSYLTGKMEHVILGKAKSHTHILGPTLFSIYLLPLGSVISKHRISFHCYADDTRLYLRTSSTSSAPLSKTETTRVGTPRQLRSKSSPSPHLSPTWVLKWTLNCPTSSTSVKHHSITSGTSPNFILHSPWQMQRSLSTPLSPPGWTTALHSSSGSLAGACREYSTSRTALPGS